MAVSMKDLGIDQLSIEDQLALVFEIWNHIATIDDGPPLTEEQKRVFDRRIADLEAHPENVLTWEEIRARVQGGK